MSTGWSRGLWYNIITVSVINLISVVDGSRGLLECVQLVNTMSELFKLLTSLYLLVSANIAEILSM
jgi:hypothetical protein